MKVTFDKQALEWSKQIQNQLTADQKERNHVLAQIQATEAFLTTFFTIVLTGIGAVGLSIFSVRKWLLKEVAEKISVHEEDIRSMVDGHLKEKALKKSGQIILIYQKEEERDKLRSLLQDSLGYEDIRFWRYQEKTCPPVKNWDLLVFSRHDISEKEIEDCVEQAGPKKHTFIVYSPAPSHLKFKKELQGEIAFANTKMTLERNIMDALRFQETRRTM
ncbi:NARF domain-containing protein [Magnetococcales bacterium HHB-1]